MNPADPSAVRDFIIAEARRLGFHRVGLIPVQAPLRYQAYLDWIEKDMHGTMAYMAAPEHVAGRADARTLAQNARTLVVVALAYAKDSLAEDRSGGAAPGVLRQSSPKNTCTDRARFQRLPEHRAVGCGTARARGTPPALS